MIDEYINKIFCGDALNVLKQLPENSIDMVMTSPAYWGLRDYGIVGQLGLEKTFTEYIDKLCNIFNEVKRILKLEGSCWVNIGDTYGGSGNGSWNAPIGIRGKQYRKTCNIDQEYLAKTKNFSKSLCLIPFRFAIEMCNRGWILRNTIIWYKPNCMPTSAHDRFTVDFEYLFFFTKNKKYYFKQQFENRLTSCENDWKKIETSRKNREKYKLNTMDSYYRNTKSKDEIIEYAKQGRNKRCIWSINTYPTKEKHFASYPEKLCITPIKAGCPEQGIVLDPFFGIGTTGLVALKLNRNFIGIDLNKEYCDIANKRISDYQKQGKLNL